MKTVTQVVKALQSILTTEAMTAAKETGAIQRQRKFTGASLAQTFVLGWLANPQATLEELAQTAGLCDAVLTPQAIDQRFTFELADFFKRLWELAVNQMISAKPSAVGLLNRFTAVCVQDSTLLSLPDELKSLWPGRGGGRKGQTNSTLKLQVRFDLVSGRLTGPFPENARGNDYENSLDDIPLPRGSLGLADLGYFRLDAFEELNEAGVFWLSRLHPKTVVYNAEGERLNLCRWLSRQKERSVDVPILLGSERRMPCRLLAVRVPPAVVRKRRSRLKKLAQRHGRPVNPEQNKLCRWTILVTNLPPEKINLDEALVLARCRWQIELLFKLWKQQTHLAESRGGNPWRVLAEIYAKLVGLIIQHWVLLTTAWQHGDRSLPKAAAVVRQHAINIICSLHSFHRLKKILKLISQSLRVTARLQKRRKHPNHCQLLENPPRAVPLT